MKALDRKLLRELWRLRGQVLAVAVIIASGVAVLVMSLSTLEALDDTTSAYYERNRFADVFANAVRAPQRVANRVAELPGVQSVEARITRYATLDIEGFAEPVIGRLVSIPETGQPVLNQLALRSGRWITPGRHDEVLLNESFAAAHGLVAGSHFTALINGHRRTLQVVGTALSPEFVYALGPGGIMPDDKRFGILWMGREALESALDLKGAFNDLAVGLLRGAEVESVLSGIDGLLGRYGGFRAIARADQLSNWFVMNEISQLRTMSTVMPTIFLAVAAFLTYMVLTRLIATERSEIGLLKAFGYSRWEISWHYMKLVLVIAVIGILAGSAMGAMFGLDNTRRYADFFHFPILIYRPSPASFVIAAMVALGTTLGGAVIAVRRAATLPPADAMRPPQPAVYRHGGLATLGWLARLDQPTRIALRQIIRWPWRSLFTTLGIAMSLGLLVMGLQWGDMVDSMAEKYFFEAQHQTMMIGLTEPRSTTAIEALAHLPGVMAVEPVRFVGADFSVGVRRHRGTITGVMPAALLQPVHDDATGHDLELPPEGLIMSVRLAQKLGIAAGDWVWVDIQAGRRPSVRLRVAALFETMIAMPVYMNLASLNRLLDERPSLEYANLLVDRNAEPDLFGKLKMLPSIGAIMLRQSAIDSFHATIGEQMLIYTTIFAVFAAALGIGVTYNSARIALSERGRELATLRVLGFTRGEISYILLAEVALLIVAALPLGCLAGLGLTHLVARLLDTELFRVPVGIQPATYGWAVILTLLATVASAAIVRRRIDKLDLIRVLKTRE
ncbi:MAG TPA: FtsX-like permease family protein [Steroidobacteraceae bacterium]|nr:FtsX-like permease family protein [Steroidobacteraceae bacterium]